MDNNNDQLFTTVVGLDGVKEIVTRNVVAYRRNAVDTSRDAAYKAKPKSGKQRLAIYNLLRDRHGLTADEISLLLDLPAQSVSARLNGLANDRLIVDSGERRKTRYGRNAIVWKTL